VWGSVRQGWRQRDPLKGHCHDQGPYHGAIAVDMAAKESVVVRFWGRVSVLCS
jgi:hypothetical protein